MTKEMYVSSTPHETKVAVTEDDQLAEIFFERENEYTLAGSIYKGRVTRVLPGMQSAFVDIGLERDAFLYVSDFLDLEEEDEDLEEVPAKNFVSNKPQAEPRNHDFHRDGHRSAEETHEADAPEAVAEERAQGGYRDQGDEGFRGGRRRRRGRRGRGFPESKFARGDQEEGEPQLTEEFEPAAPTSTYPPIVLPGESISKYQRSEVPVAEQKAEGEPFVIEGGFDGEGEPEFERPEAQKEFAEPEGPAPVERSREAAPERKPAPVSQRILLPGESIAKYQKKAPAEQVSSAAEVSATSEAEAAPSISEETTPPEAAVPAPVPVPVERPVQRVNLPPAPIVLPGESISKYRKKAAEPEQAPEESAVEVAGSVAEEATEQPSAPVQEETAAPVEESPKPKLDEPRTEVRMERRNTVAPFILPGESIAKYRRAQDRRAKALQEEIERQPEEKLAEEASEMVASNEPLAVTLEREISAEPAPTEVISETLVSEHESLEGTTEPAPESTSGQQDQVEPEAERRFEEMNVASTFGGDAAEPAVESEEHFADAEDEQVEHEQTEHEEADEKEFQSQPEERTPEEIESTRAFMREAQGIALDPAGNQFRHPFAPGEGDLEEEEIEEEDESDYRMYSQDEESGDFVELEEEVLDSAARKAETVDANGLTDAIEDELIDEETSEAEYPATNGVDQQMEDELGEEFEEAEMEAEGTAAPSPGTPEYRRGARPRFDRRRGGHRGPGGRPMRPRREQQRAMPLISDLLKEGQEVLIQIAKEPIGKKGARITSHIALPGRFLVYMPTVNHIGVSRKINSDEERQRLKRIMISEREGGHGGFIVRTAAAGVGEDELRADIRFLKTLWADIKHRFESNKAPSLIYHDLNLVERILRDQVTSDFAALWVDTEAEYERLVRFANRFQPNLVRKIKLYTKSTPLFEQFNIQSELDKALKSKVWLKSGGYIVINQTEALVAIDINTGKYVGKTARLEDTIVKTNVDAIKEIVRQIRLRDLGGIIVIDFIDMDERKNRQKVMQALEEALRADRAPSKVLQFNDFGLVAITRKRVKQSLERTLGEPCAYCTGTGLVKSVTTVCNEIYVEMRKMSSQLEKGDVLLRVNPEIAKALKAQGGRWVQEMEEMTKKNILIKSDPLLHQEHFDIEG